jgi:hypothetical protein
MTDVNFDALKRGLFAGLDRMETTGASAEDAPAEIIKTAVVLDMRINGPLSTIEGLALLLKQLVATFPEEWSQLRARHMLRNIDPEGRA